MRRYRRIRNGLNSGVRSGIGGANWGFANFLGIMLVLETDLRRDDFVRLQRSEMHDESWTLATPTFKTGLLRIRASYSFDLAGGATTDP